MKILNICMNGDFTEGYSYQDNLLTEYQKKAGHDVTIVTTTKKRDSRGKLYRTGTCDKVMDNGVRLIRINSNGKILEFLGIYPKLSDIIAECVPDFIFIHGLCSFAPYQAIRYKRKNKVCKIVADNHQDIENTKVNKFPFTFQLFLHRLFWKKWIEDVDKIYGTTSWRKQFACEYYGIPDGKLDTLIMGIDSDHIPEDKVRTRNEIRKKLGIAESSFMFVTGGKLSGKRKILETVRAFNRLDDKSGSLLIFGSIASDIEEEFRKLSEKDSRIRYIGYIPSEEINKYFIASDFGIFPGLHSVLWEEAMGCGLPCLFKRYGERDHTEVCDNCICLGDVDEESIFMHINKVLKNRDFYDALKKNTEKAAETFSYHAIAKKSVECAE